MFSLESRGQSSPKLRESERIPNKSEIILLGHRPVVSIVVPLVIDINPQTGDSAAADGKPFGSTSVEKYAKAEQGVRLRLLDRVTPAPLFTTEHFELVRNRPYEY